MKRFKDVLLDPSRWAEPALCYSASVGEKIIALNNCSAGTGNASRITMEPSSPLLKDAYPTFADRLLLLASLTGNMNQLRLKSGQSAGGLEHYLKGGEPTRPVLENLARAAGVHSGFLVDGTGPIRPVMLDTRTAIVQKYLRYAANRPDGDGATARGEFVRAYNTEVVAPEPRLARLSLYELSLWLNELSTATAEEGEHVPIPMYDLDTVDDASFRPDANVAARRASVLSLRRDTLTQWKLDPAQVMLFVTHSADDALKPGDWVLCDCRPAQPKRNGLYVIREDGYYAIRRLQFLTPQRIRLFIPDPADEPGADTSAERDAADVELVGRVVLFCRRLRS